MPTQYNNPDDVAVLVKRYLDGFYRNYKVPRHFDEEDDMMEWLEGAGARYKDWMYYKGHPQDQHCVVHIKDPKWCTLFELRWSHLVTGMIDRARS